MRREKGSQRMFSDINCQINGAAEYSLIELQADEKGCRMGQQAVDYRDAPLLLPSPAYSLNGKRGESSEKVSFQPCV